MTYRFIKIILKKNIKHLYFLTQSPVSNICATHRQKNILSSSFIPGAHQGNGEWSPSQGYCKYTQKYKMNHRYT